MRKATLMFLFFALCEEDKFIYTYVLLDYYSYWYAILMLGVTGHIVAAFAELQGSFTGRSCPLRE